MSVGNLMAVTSYIVITSGHIWPSSCFLFFTQSSTLCPSVFHEIYRRIHAHTYVLWVFYTIHVSSVLPDSVSDAQSIIAAHAYHLTFDYHPFCSSRASHSLSNIIMYNTHTHIRQYIYTLYPYFTHTQTRILFINTHVHAHKNILVDRSPAFVSVPNYITTTEYPRMLMI